MEETDRGVSRAEFEEFKKAFSKEVKDIKDMLCEVAKQLGEPKAVSIYHCSEEGCKFVSDDLGAFVEHTVDEALKKRSLAEETFWGEEEKPKRTHKTLKEYLDCPKCFPAFEKLMLEKGWKKTEPKPEKEPF